MIDDNRGQEALGTAILLIAFACGAIAGYALAPRPCREEHLVRLPPRENPHIASSSPRYSKAELDCVSGGECGR